MQIKVVERTQEILVQVKKNPKFTRASNCFLFCAKVMVITRSQNFTQCHTLSVSKSFFCNDPSKPYWCRNGKVSPNIPMTRKTSKGKKYFFIYFRTMLISHDIVYFSRSKRSSVARGSWTQPSGGRRRPKSTSWRGWRRPTRTRYVFF